MNLPSLVLSLLVGAATLVSADLVVTPINQNEVVDKVKGDCFFGAVTPQGCGFLRK
ncbi:hypothetical protein GMORB2_5324 [Geosmithia morbida]|uniref:Uncharacterized protein n=1 Tax=Geosmithia morbida TaxID=1094350 RepID=A0A9P4YX18_9HYPO|nr:uncharacterized protein GMORB2_5324 [Geosmithia morbida]KAF4124658.1 hypothetical protein GMORB2_5324 [Geosmithia morbida]